MSKLEEENGSISVSDAIKITELENKIQNLQTKIEELENGNSELSEKNNALQQELDNLKEKAAELADIESIKANLEDELNTLKEENTQIKQEKENLTNEVQEIKNDSMKKETDLANTQRELNEKSEDYQDKQHTIDKLRESVSEMESAKSEIEAQLEVEKDEKATIENKYNELLSDSSRLEHIKTELRDKEEALRRFQIIAEKDPSYSWLSTLEKFKVIELKRLAMSTGSSTHAILRYVQMLESAGLVEIEMHGKDDPNPTIKLK